MDNNQEREINLISLCFRILLKWRWIIICAIICAVLAGGYKYYKDYKTYTNMTEEAASLAATKVEATNSQIQYVQDAIEYRLNRIEILQKDLDDLQKYLDERHAVIDDSPLMDVEYMDVPYSLVTFELDIPVPESYDDYDEYVYVSNNAKLLYTNYMTSEDGWNAIAAKAGIEDTTYFRYMITAWASTGHTISVQIYDLGLVDSTNLANAAVEVMKDRAKELKSKGLSDIDLVYDGTYTGVGRYDGVKDVQDRLRAELTNAHNQADGIVNTINTFYTNIADLNKQLDTLGDPVEVTEGVAKPSLSKKYIAIGLILGIFLVAGIEALKVVLSNRIQEKEDVETLYNQYYYGNICSAETSKKFLGFVDNAILKLKNGGKNMSSYPVQVSVVANGIKLSCKKNELKNLVITGTSDAVLDGDSVKAIKEQLEADGINVNVVKNICINTDAMNACEEAGNVVLIEGVGKSYYKDVEEEISKAQAYNIKILGIVSVE
ncbi:MAG: hypothetical protein K5659_03960 [Lachnospiraceae bacterium]|nr:hypothetical protein [Lachnospiraceae bacterium]